VRQGALAGLGISLEGRQRAGAGDPAAGQAPDLAASTRAPGADSCSRTGTPQPIVERMAAECAKATASQEVKDRLAATGVEPSRSAAAEFAAHLKQQREAFREGDPGQQHPAGLRPAGALPLSRALRRLLEGALAQVRRR
jgi:hypothetical protein